MNVRKILHDKSERKSKQRFVRAIHIREERPIVVGGNESSTLLVEKGRVVASEAA